jgi:hypothetical protein
MVNLLLRDDEKEVTPRLEKATSRLLKNVQLSFDRLMALSKVEGRRYPHPSSSKRKD